AAAPSPPPRASAAPVEEAAPASTAKAAAPAAKPAREPVASRGDDAVAWERLVAQGSFEAVLDAAKRRGLEAVIAKASLADLRALADAARYARRADLAERVLLAERQRFAGTAAARDAAFLL